MFEIRIESTLMSKKNIGFGDLAALTGMGNPEANAESHATAKSGSVYSTELGRTCPGCGKAKAACSCDNETVPEGDGTVRIQRETKGRKGKGVTLVSGVLLAPAEMKKLAKELKQKCGVGGAVKDGVIEIQGDVREQLFEEMKSRGYKVKKAGG